MRVRGVQRRWYWVAPNSTSRSASLRNGLRSPASTSTPRCTAGRAAIRSNQPFRWGSRPSRCPGSATAQPREDRDVGDRVLVAGEVGAASRAACRARRRGAWPRCCSGRSRRDLLGRVQAEVVGLPEHRARRRPSGTSATRASRSGRDGPWAGTGRSSRRGRSGSRPTRTALIGCAAGAVGIDDRRNAVVRADRQELGLELLAGADVHRDAL